MFRKLNGRLSPATPIAALALFAALGGVSYAAGTIGTADLKNGAVTKKKLHRNAVAPGKIRDGAVIGPKIRDGAVGTAKIGDDAVTTEKIADDAVTGAKVAEATLGQVPSAASADSATSAQTAAAVGPDGVDAAAIKSGAVTAPKLGTIAVRSETHAVPAEGTIFQSVPCLSGERLLTGGAVWSGSFNAASAEKLHLVYSTPSGNSWVARLYNGNAEARTIIIRAVCLAG